MEQNFKPITKQLAIAALILSSVTVLSFGIRQVRFSAHRAKNIENTVIAGDGEFTPSARPSNPENQSQPEQPLYVNAEPDSYSADSFTVDVEPDPQYANAPDLDEETPSEDYSESKSLKGDYAKAKGKGLEKISLGDYEDLYRTGEGELWYVNKQPDGSTAKMQVQIDDTTGELIVVESGYYAKSEGSQGLRRISVGDREDLYLTGEGQVWYVGEQPDGSTAKMQLETDETTGEIDIVEERATKD